MKGAQSTEKRAQSTEHRAQSTEQGAESRGSKEQRTKMLPTNTLTVLKVLKDLKQ